MTIQGPFTKEEREAGEQLLAKKEGLEATVGRLEKELRRRPDESPPGPFSAVRLAPTTDKGASARWKRPRTLLLPGSSILVDYELFSLA